MKSIIYKSLTILGAVFYLGGIAAVIKGGAEKINLRQETPQITQIEKLESRIGDIKDRQSRETGDLFKKPEVKKSYLDAVNLEHKIVESYLSEIKEQPEVQEALTEYEHTNNTIRNGGITSLLSTFPLGVGMYAWVTAKKREEEEEKKK